MGDVPPQLRPLLGALSGVMRRREPAIRERVQRLRAENPDLGPDDLARRLIRTTRRRVASTAAASGAAGIVPGLGTVIAVGTAASQSLYALEQETELVLAIAIIYGRELADSDQRLLEALVVVGLAGGAVKLRDDLLISGGQLVTVAAFRRLPRVWLGRAGNRVLHQHVVHAEGRHGAVRVDAVLPARRGARLAGAATGDHPPAPGRGSPRRRREPLTGSRVSQELQRDSRGPRERAGAAGRAGQRVEVLGEPGLPDEVQRA